MQEKTQDKIYTQEDLRREGILTGDYLLNLTPGVFYAVLDLKADAPRSKCLRLFFTFEDGRRVFATAHWWQKYLGFYEIPTGTRLKLEYAENARGEVYLTSASEEEVWHDPDKQRLCCSTLPTDCFKGTP